MLEDKSHTNSVLEKFKKELSDNYSEEYRLLHRDPTRQFQIKDLEAVEHYTKTSSCLRGVIGKFIDGKGDICMGLGALCSNCLLKLEKPISKDSLLGVVYKFSTGIGVSTGMCEDKIVDAPNSSMNISVTSIQSIDSTKFPSSGDNSIMSISPVCTRSNLGDSTKWVTPRKSNVSLTIDKLSVSPNISSGLSSSVSPHSHNLVEAGKITVKISRDRSKISNLESQRQLNETLFYQKATRALDHMNSICFICFMHHGNTRNIANNCKGRNEVGKCSSKNKIHGYSNGDTLCYHCLHIGHDGGHKMCKNKITKQLTWMGKLMYYTSRFRSKLI